MVTIAFADLAADGSREVAVRQTGEKSVWVVALTQL
jgi:hypothetical protein